MSRAHSRFVALLLTALMVVVPAGAAAAHDQLTGSEPADGSTVEAPDEIVLTFSGAVSQLGAQMAVTGPDGSSVVEDEPEVDGTEVEQDLVDDLPPGDYTALWRVTSADGHPISGEFAFTVGEGPDDSGDDATDDSSTAASSEATTGAATGAATGATGGDADDADVTAEPAEAQGPGGLPVWAWVLVALAAAGVLGLLARTWTRGRE